MEKAASLGRTAHALTDHGSVSGHVLFEKAAKQHGVKPIYGLEAYSNRDALVRGEENRKKHHLSLLAKNLTGYRNLIRLVTRSYDEGFYYRPTIDGRMLMEQGEGLIVLSGCETGHFMRAIERQEWAEARRIAAACRDVFGDDYYIEIQHFPHMVEKNAAAFAIGEELGIKQVLTCDSHYIAEDGWKYQQLLWSIRDAKPVDEFKIEHAYIWEPDKLQAFVRSQLPTVDWDRIFQNTCEIADKVETYTLPRAPHVQFPMAEDKIKYMRQRCLARLSQLGLADKPEYLSRLDSELVIIADKQYEDYFLVVDDMIGWAKRAGIFVGPARGSSAGSLVCYGLRITEIDPIKHELLFERFVDPTRVDLPDIDCDFEDDRRGEVFQYMKEKWGEDSVAFISTFARLGGRSTLDDAARSYHIPLAEIDIIKKHLVDRSSGDQRSELTVQDTLDEFPEARAVFERYPQLEMASGVQGKIRHLGKHAAGLIVTSEPIYNYVAVYKTGEEKIIAVDWRDSMYLNLMKIDVLGLKELSIVHRIAGKAGLTLEDVYAIPLDDPATIAAFNNKDFFGVFQFTGLATKGVASQVIFENVGQIADVNALSRPGPLHAGATEAYIRGRRSGNYTPILPQADVQPIIAPTFGQIIYQEQVMRILREVGGLGWQDVCDIRNIMGKSKGSEAFDNFWPKWEDGTRERGMSADDAKQIWECIRLYGKHGFNKSHALAYGIVSFWSMYFKTHYPAFFYWAQLQKSPDKNQDVRFIRDALRRGIQFLPLTLENSGANWTVTAEGAIRPGWNALEGVGPKAATELEERGPFSSIADLTERVNKRIVNIRVRTAIEANIGKTAEQIYGLEEWDALLATVHERITANEFNGANTYDGEYYRIAGKVIKINKKNRIEEYKDKGKDISRIDQSKPQDYVLFVIEDGTDTVLAYINTEQYQKWNKTIWMCKDGFVNMLGRKASVSEGMPLFIAHELKLLKKAG